MWGAVIEIIIAGSEASITEDIAGIVTEIEIRIEKTRIPVGIIPRKMNASKTEKIAATTSSAITTTNPEDGVVIEVAAEEISTEIATTDLEERAMMAIIIAREMLITNKINRRMEPVIITAPPTETNDYISITSGRTTQATKRKLKM